MDQSDRALKRADAQRKTIRGIGRAVGDGQVPRSPEFFREEFLVENELCGCEQQFCAENTGFKCGKELLFKVARAPHTFLFGKQQLQPGRGFSSALRIS